MSANCPLDPRVPLEDHPTEKQAEGTNFFSKILKPLKQSNKTKVRPFVAEQESQVHPDTDEKQAEGTNFLIRLWKAVKPSNKTKTKVRPFVAEQESQVHPDTDGPSKMEQTPDTNPVDHETMMCLPGQVCEDLCVPGPSKMKKTQLADPVDAQLLSLPEPSSCDLDDNYFPSIMSSAAWSFPEEQQDLSRSGGLEGFLCPPLPGQVPVEPAETSSGRTAQGAVEASSVNKRSKEFFECLYNVEKLIGSGEFGSVYLGTRKFDGRKVAIKRISKVDNKRYLNIPGHPEPLITEVALLLMMCRVPINSLFLRLYEWFEHPSEFTLIMEYPGPCETLKDTMSHRHWCDLFSWYIMSQAVYAVKDCIDHGVFHSDIHSGNFLFNEDNKDLKLIDFGCGQLFSSEGYDSNTYGGAPGYCPPEVFTEPRFHAVPANVWSLGVLLYELSNNCLPFNSIMEIKQAKVTFKNPDLSEYCKDLIRQCLDLDPTKRPSLEQMLEHEWFDNDLNLEWRM